MKPEIARAIERLAGTIADGTAVDWTAIEHSFGPDEQQLVRRLHLIGTLADVYRSLPSDPDAEPEEDALADPQPAGPRWGRLILLDRIGYGTSADVFRAWDVDLQREVALKLLRVDGTTADAGANARVLQEARRIARVRHPHVVHVYGAERHEERIGLWMELVRGRSLDDIVRTDGSLDADAATRVGVDLSSAVAAVHAAGLLHRDIKAQNVIQDESGRIVLMDFGAGEDIGASKSGVAGTPLYLAPEVLAGRPASAATDVYALGVLLFYLTTGRFPVQAGSIEELRAAHRAGQQRAVRQVNPKVPAALAAVIARAIAPDPAARYATAAAMEADLRRVAEGKSPTAVVTTGWRGWLAVGATAAAVLALLATIPSFRPFSSRPIPEATSIAVLPLAFVAGQADAPSLAEGLTDQLITTLGQVKALRVTAHTSVRQYRGTTEAVSAIARQLGVGSVLEGSIAVDSSTANPRVRVNVRLIRAGTDAQIWSDTFERSLGDLLALERDIARAVARSVSATLTPREAERFARSAATIPAAQRAYLQGISYLAQNRQGPEVRPALEALQQAIAIDDSFAPAHAAVARAYVILGFDGEISQREAYAAAQEAARRALALDPDLPEARVALADVSFYYDWNFDAAEAEYRRAIDLAPSAAYARTQYARLLAAMARTDEARRQADDAVAVDPLTPDVTLTQGLMAFYQRRYDEAHAILRRVVAMDPRFPGAYITLARVEEGRGDLLTAIDLTDRAVRLSDRAQWRAQAVRLRALAGQRSAARQGFARLRARLAEEHRTLAAPHEAYIRLAFDEREAALELLSAAVASRDPSVLWLAVDPRVDVLRSDPRFEALVSRVGRP